MLWPPCAQDLETALRLAFDRLAEQGVKKGAATHDWTTPAVQWFLQQDPAVQNHPEAVIKTNNGFQQMTKRLLKQMGLTEVPAGSDFRQMNKGDRRKHLNISGPGTKVWTDLQVQQTLSHPARQPLRS